MTGPDRPSRSFGQLVPGTDHLAELRRLMPARPVSWTEAHSVAERQATLLLKRMYVAEPPVPQLVIASLPGIVVDWREAWPVSGTALKVRDHWRIVIHAGESRRRQRFSLAHEFKHVLDDPVVDRMFRHLPEFEREDRAERLCNYFAAALLMPRAWLKRDWCAGQQDVRSLARRYYVSEEAMGTRLSELGLTRMTLAIERSATRHVERPA